MLAVHCLSRAAPARSEHVTVHTSEPATKRNEDSSGHTPALTPKRTSQAPIAKTVWSLEAGLIVGMGKGKYAHVCLATLRSPCSISHVLTLRASYNTQEDICVLYGHCLFRITIDSSIRFIRDWILLTCTASNSDVKARDTNRSHG